MKKYYVLDKQTVEKLISVKKPGAYFLCVVLNNRFYELYVGRSDSCLRTRLLQHIGAGIYTHFRFRMCRSKKGAFLNECVGFHTYKHMANQIHPARNDEVECCPICRTDEEEQIISEHNAMFTKSKNDLRDNLMVSEENQEVC